MKRKIAAYIAKWKSRGYQNGIPEEAPPKLEAHNKAPSYRTICHAILKNDRNLLTLGFSRPDCRIYNQLKRQELISRGVIQPDQEFPMQLTMF